MAKVIGNENDTTVGYGNLSSVSRETQYPPNTNITPWAGNPDGVSATSYAYQDTNPIYSVNYSNPPKKELPSPEQIKQTTDDLLKGRYFFNNAMNNSIEEENKENWIDEVDYADYLSKINYSQRVSLNVAPIDKKKNVSSTLSSTEWDARLRYILGEELTPKELIADDTNFASSFLDRLSGKKSKIAGSGFLYKLFGGTKGIVFQYTPTIKMQHKVNYDAIEILHSNLSINQYKNTPPPGITLTGIFTADNKENAEYMYGVMCFLRAMTKCEFGMKSRNEKGGNEGVPPPTLYLNGWGNMINNVPVVITGFDIDLPKESHYVYLEDYDVWLPTQMEFTIGLSIQFNLNKYKEQFDLNEYKRGVLGQDKDSNITLVNTLGYVEASSNEFIQDKEIEEYKASKLYTTKKATKFNGSGWTW